MALSGLGEVGRHEHLGRVSGALSAAESLFEARVVEDTVVEARRITEKATA